MNDVDKRGDRNLGVHWKCYSGSMNQQRINGMNCNQFRSATDFVMSGPGPQGATHSPGVPNRVPPPLPPRRTIQSLQPYSNYGPLGSSFGYGNNWNYRGYGGYGRNGPYPGISSYNDYGQFGGPSGDVESRFVQFAEESTRPAFHSIETMISTFSSVTMMLESTFFAMTSSFRAILSVADNIGKLRSSFGQFLSVFALIRFMKWLWWKIMYSLGLRANDPNIEVVWQKTALEVINGERTGPSNWPIFMFLSLLFAIPYLIHKLVNKSQQTKINPNNPNEWMQCNEPIYTAIASYDFNASSNDELNLKCGKKVWVAPKSLQPRDSPGWWRVTDSINVGLVPASYLTLAGQLKKKTESNETHVSTPNTKDDTTLQDTNKNEKAESESKMTSDFQNFEQEFNAEEKLEF
ncbi:probable peroxisomal membrane protein PEX13 isoform X2 [Cephus cinctus]|uniref:Peroxisomal membrane protein PEX13 n=1 Tax=Cephus cinctus TaxID=211228 RepID=A0AAJ7RLR1_CEPCN|nr:probable peroxisomal membrane protein PEX13 isoform X2 [Cephus cinctus]